MARTIDIGIIRFKPGVAFQRQREALRMVGEAMRALPGFLDQRTYHDAESDRWVDVVAWQSPEEALASASIAQQPEIARIFTLFEESGTILGIYEQVS